ncbi:hypothetical protein [Dactylosporangium matsuzakiense]|nr:hypothetical protein [Dactylosporangium matsuzakiense]
MISQVRLGNLSASAGSSPARSRFGSRLAAMSLLAFLGLRCPVRMLPVLLFEVTWKVIWIAAVAVPHLIAGDMDDAARKVLINCSLVVVIIALIPWRYAWKPYVRTSGGAWRGSRGSP